jgi:uncharacterized pyridoxal phosphate-containing UPF0001 family protein
VSRRDELERNLEAVRGRIAAACADAGRAADDVRLLADLGVTDVGENRHLEAQEKAAECADLDLTWHFIGGLQSNKAAAVASYAAVVESGDPRKLVGPLSRGAHQRAREVDVLLQVSLDPPGREGRSGADPAELADLGLTWHFIGGLQSNKAAAVAAYADVVESVDRVKLVAPLAKGAHRRSHEVDVLLQVSLDPPDREGRAGADPGDLPALARAVEPATRSTTSWGTPAVDVGAGVRAQLEREGVAVVDLSRCTMESPDLFSYRRDEKRSGRQAGLIRRVA